MVSVTNISKSFGQTVAVDGLSFTIKKGEIVGLLGPNGAGKTTTMRLIAGFLSPDKGSILINSISVFDKPTLAQTQIGYLPENNPLYKNMLVAELLNFSADLKRIPLDKKKEALDFAVKSANISSVYYHPISELSKGFKQRVGIAVCLLHKPNVLIMDEPTEGLDPNQRAEIRSLIKKLSQNHTIIISTHVMQEVEAVCNRMIIINKGRLVADGTPAQLSRLSGKGSQIVIDLEGKDIEKNLYKIKGIEKINLRKIKGNRMTVYLQIDKKIQIQPEISKLAARHGWIIWKLVEEKRELEDIFLALTK